MSATTAVRIEQSLDPEDWTRLRELGHRMIDDMFAYLENVRERPVWQPIPDDVKDSFAGEDSSHMVPRTSEENMVSQ